MNVAARDHPGVMAGLKSWFGASLTDLRPVTGGTFSICFMGALHGRPRFFKTHAMPSGRATLAREAAFLQATAPDRVDPRLLHVTEEHSDRTWLHTNVLHPCEPLTPPTVRHLIAGYETGLRTCSALADLVPQGDSIHLLLSEAALTQAYMVNQTLFSTFVQDSIQISIERLQSVCMHGPWQLCHGDLGPANIMTDGHAAVALDWEDACWSMPGYDYLYWLTFFNNRRWLSRDALGHTPLGRSNEVALMVVIVWLKSWLSIRNSSHRHNTISLDQRLREVIALD